MLNRHDHNIILQDGTKLSFEQFFKENFPKFYAFTGRFIIEAFTREDIVQEAFIDTWGQRHERFKDELSLHAYMYTSIKNKCIDHIRHNKVKEQFSDYYLQETSSHEFLMDAIIDEESRFLIHQAINRLSPQCREVILHHLAGLKNKEIAEKMNISEATVKFHKASAYKQLHKSLGPLLLSFIIFRK